MISTTTTTTTTTITTTTTPVTNGTICDWTTATWECCTAVYPCELGEGDCDSNDECIGHLKCGTDNCGDTYASDADCCMDPTPSK